MKNKLALLLDKPFPLRYSVPALLIVFAFALTGFLIADGIRLSKRRIEAEARLHLENLGRQTAARFENYHAQNLAGLAVSDLARLRQEPHLRVAVVFDDAGQILASTGTLYQPTADNKGLIAIVHKNAAAQLRLNRDGSLLAAAFPVRMNNGQIGVLYLQSSLRERKDQQLAEDFQRAEIFCGTALLLVILACFYLDRILTWRVSRLIAVTRGMAAGDLSRRATLAGVDELAELGRAFNHMAQQVEQRTLDLRESQGRYQRFVETAYEGIFAVDEGLHLTFVNRRMAEMLGSTIDEMVGREWDDFLFSEDAAEQHARMKQRQIGEAICYECRLRHRNGSEIWVILSTTISWDKSGQFGGLFGMATDITKRKHAEAQLQLQSSALTSCANSIVVTDPEGNFEWVNPAFCRLTGYTADEIIGRSIRVLRSGDHSEEFYANLWNTINAGKIWQGELINQRKDHTKYTERMTITPVLGGNGRIRHFVAVKEDITQQREMENNLREMQKMEAIAHLAGGVAHEFNNIFTGIIGYANSLKTAGRLSGEDTETVAKITATTRRATDVIRQLLLFSRQQPLQPRPINLNETLSHLFNILRHYLGDKIAIQCTLAENLPAVHADPGMMEQIIMNLAAHARETMPEGGRLTFTTSAVELAAATKNPEARAGRFVCFSVADSGDSFDTERLRRVFEPYGSRKQTGGLGLATVYGIVKQHQGWVEVFSRINQGTTFNIYLPITDLPILPVVETVVPVDVPAALSQTRTILLVEDDDTVRKLAGACLRRFNCRVLEADSGAVAMQIWREHANQIDLLFTDIILPGDWDGRQLAAEFRRQRPTLKVVFSSGHNRERDGLARVGEPGECHLPKPYDPETLQRTVWEVLQNGSLANGQATVKT